MKTVRGFHGEWNMGSPGGWDYQRTAQILGKRAWEMIRQSVDPRVEIDFAHPQINPRPGFARMLLRAHANRHGANPVHAVLLAETETLDAVQENKNVVKYLNSLDGVKASLAGPGHMSLKNGRVCCRGEEATVVFMDFNADTLVKIGQHEDIRPITEAIGAGILVNPRGMEPLGAKGLFESITGECADLLSEASTEHTPWTRLFHARRTTGPAGEAIDDLPAWTEQNWKGLVLKPAHGYSGHGIFVGDRADNPSECIQTALDSGDYIVQQLVPLPLWSERSVCPGADQASVELTEWQTDFRCFVTDEGLQGFLARFGGVPTNVGSGGGIQPLAVLVENIPYREAVDRLNEALFKLGYHGYQQIQDEIERQAVEMGFTYLLGPIKILLRPRILTSNHLDELRQYAHDLWTDSLRLEELWRKGRLAHVVTIGDDEKNLAMKQPWRGSPALMVSDGLFSFGADLID
jgi:hypothetical protein